MNIVSVFGRYSSGYIADKSIGTFATLIVLLVVTALADLVIWLPFKSSAAALWIFAVVYGFFFGGILSLLPSGCSHVVREEVFGSRYATMYGISGIFFFGMMPAASAIIGDGNSDARNDGFIVLMAALSFLSAGFYLAVRFMTVGFTLKKF
ncbi:unnamed protein product [Ambrosiozyma monospora]|uniref:Unnamed protein product n=1 Tax=Ambrosiozyma monospora TaxID=43982 RepID=A0ACB5TYD1_AMBMO|nr:unnamed protein product [Ambrosiozyma monospora]